MQSKTTIRSRKTIGWDIVYAKKSVIAFFICALAILLFYRVQLTWALLKSPVRPFDMDPSRHSLWLLAGCSPNDVALLWACFLIPWFVSHGSTLAKSRPARTFLTLSGFILLHLLLITLSLIHGTHARLLFEAQTGLNTFVLQEFLLNVPLAEIVKLTNGKDMLFLLAPIGLFWGVISFPFSFRIRILKVSAGLLLLMSFLPIAGTGMKTDPPPDEIRLNPVLFLLSDLLGQNTHKGPFEDGISPNVGDGMSMRLDGGDFQDRMKPLKFLPPQGRQPWNIVFFVMESAGRRHIFDSHAGRPMPMPFLFELAQESWDLKHHYASANISTKAVFSLFSGLYDFFSQETFGIRPDAHVPSLQNYLPGGYECFLVTPAPIQWYFPAAFVKNSGFQEMHHFDNLNLLKTKQEQHAFGRYIGRDEVQTIDFFNRRIRQSRGPFLGVYLSFAAHLPYFDYGPEYSIRPPDGPMVNRYYNNLNLLDHMIRRIYENLERTGLLERTILVVVGDHGQAFGQHHPDNFMHHRYSYNENIETPAFLFQPALFKPKRFEIPTSHVDLLPTLLDAMRISFQPERLNGESLFHHRLNRKYIFIYGQEGTITSLNREFVKVQYSLKNKSCRAFDLKSDPEEKRPLDCGPYENQRSALMRFPGLHNANLIRYNQWREEHGRAPEGGQQEPIGAK